jgi:hypothetical protein
LQKYWSDVAIKEKRENVRMQNYCFCVVCILFPLQNNIIPLKIGIFLMTWAERVLMQAGVGGGVGVAVDLCHRISSDPSYNLEEPSVF